MFQKGFGPFSLVGKEEIFRFLERMGGSAILSDREGISPELSF
jgi:hypothetical protein